MYWNFQRIFFRELLPLLFSSETQKHKIRKKIPNTVPGLCLEDDCSRNFYDLLDLNPLVLNRA